MLTMFLREEMLRAAAAADYALPLYFKAIFHAFFKMLTPLLYFSFDATRHLPHFVSSDTAFHFRAIC